MKSTKFCIVKEVYALVSLCNFITHKRYIFKVWSDWGRVLEIKKVTGPVIEKMAPGATSAAEGDEEHGTAVEAWRAGRPNIVITGTPGVGKTTVAARVAAELGLLHVDVGSFARERDLLAEHDAELDTYYMHEDAVLDALEPLMTQGGVILDHHSCDWFPQRWIHLLVVLTCSTETLYDRLDARGYSQAKLAHNVQAEIMGVVHEEAVNAYPNLNALQLANDSETQQESNVGLIKRHWLQLAHPNPSDEIH